MQYLDCPCCHASFHTGVIYEEIDFCPRCGAPFFPTPPRLREKLSAALRHRTQAQGPDWEAITGAQYVAQRVTRTDPRAEEYARSK
jgi:Zn-finger nucleic acid-binding protein